ncbi:hypothetical protein AB0O70_10605 [Microbacterium paraoxydans]|jgi:hypothetical protein|uniref:hypothetical protein n=1 Tax=Microbacterium TaxID=33882 RepID=UPI00046B02E4|nr:MULTISPECIES: hypothetical protein [Microbacterium]AVL98048.1 hypothetical protein C6C15_13585 [Microbacterium sp. str. 'China']MCT2224322.1 hypothetical protein [Microbacterium paraoxydans]
MPPLAPVPTPRARAERILQSRIVIAVGLALLLVVGAWSASHGTADAHATLCLAPGVSQPVDTSAAGPVTEVAPADPAAAAACAAAALCCVALVLLFRHLRTRSGLRFRDLLPRATTRFRAGPRPFVPAVSLIQLSISRT